MDEATKQEAESGRAGTEREGEGEGVAWEVGSPGAEDRPEDDDEESAEETERQGEDVIRAQAAERGDIFSYEAAREVLLPRLQHSDLQGPRTRKKKERG